MSNNPIIIEESVKVTIYSLDFTKDDKLILFGGEYDSELKKIKNFMVKKKMERVDLVVLTLCFRLPSKSMPKLEK